MLAWSAPVLCLVPHRAEGFSHILIKDVLVPSPVGCVRLDFHVPALSTSAQTSSYNSATRKTLDVDLAKF